jgi:CBS domain-containing protein
MKRCGDVMTREVRTISTTASALDAAIVMREQRIGFLPICDPGSGRVVAVVTDRDLVTRMCAADRRASETPLSDLATSSPLCAFEDTDLPTVEDAMVKQQITRVVVVNREGQPIGVISLSDILRTDRQGRAMRTAQGVLARQTGPGIDPETVTLTPEPAAAPPSASGAPPSRAEAAVLDSPTARSREDVNVGGRETRDIKEFPR